MFRALDYQDRVLQTLDAYLDALGKEKQNADKVTALAAENPDLDLPIPDFAAKVSIGIQTGPLIGVQK